MQVQVVNDPNENACKNSTWDMGQGHAKQREDYQTSLQMQRIKKEARIMSLFK